MDARAELLVILVGVVLNGTDRESTPYSRYYYEAYVKNVTESKA